jgi:hypothetical protein
MAYKICLIVALFAISAGGQFAEAKDKCDTMIQKKYLGGNLSIYQYLTLPHYSREKPLNIKLREKSYICCSRICFLAEFVCA